MNIRKIILFTLLLAINLSLSSELRSQGIPERVILKDIPYIKQYGSYCAPASASMVLKYYGATIDQTQLANLASASSANHQGTNLQDLSKAIRKMGYGTQILWGTSKTNNKSKAKCQKFFYTETIPRMNQYIAADIPLLLHIKKPAWDSGHLIVVVGYDQGAKAVFYMDPAVKRSKIHKISYKKLAVYTTLEYQKGFYQVFMIVEPNSSKRYKVDRKKKETRANKVENALTNEILTYLTSIQSDSNLQQRPMSDLIYSSGYLSNQQEDFKINYENIDMLRPELSSSKTKSTQFAKKHSIKAIENNLLNNNVVAILFNNSVEEIEKTTNAAQQYLQNKNKTETANKNKFILLTGYDKTKREFTGFVEEQDSTCQYTDTTLSYTEVIDKLNNKTKYLNHKNKEKTKYSQRVVTFYVQETS